jgi:hypothetical protein
MAWRWTANQWERLFRAKPMPELRLQGCESLIAFAALAVTEIQSVGPID